MSSRVAFLWLLTLVWLLAWPATVLRAEVFELENGQRLQGRLLNAQQSPRTEYEIELSDGTRMTLAKEQVKKVSRPSPVRLEYEAIRPKYADTVEGQWELAQWCREHKLSSLREVHLRRILELDPDHQQARRGLGYIRVDGQWRTQEEVMTERGYVRSGGTWKLPQEVEVAERTKKVKRAEAQWQADLHQWRKWLEDSDRTAEAAEKIRGINDPHALKALANYLRDQPSDAERGLVLEALMRIQTPEAAQMVAVLALDDPQDEIRVSALEYLGREKPPGVVKYFMQQLRSPDNSIVNRAGYALGLLGDTAAVPALIQALVTTHKFKVTEGSGGGGGMGMNATFARPDSNGVIQNPVAPGQSGGLGSFSMGNSTRLVKVPIRNSDVLDALVKLTERNDDYDVTAWKRWYAAQKKSHTQGLNARRDDPS